MLKRRFVCVVCSGGSHDNVKMLPLKAGVALMALGAMVNGAKAVTIVPCGNNA